MRSLDTPLATGTAAGPLEQSPGRARIRRWFLPDMAAVGGIATLLCVFAGSGGPSGLLRDSDTGWHIRTGERILSTHALPTEDPFSFSKPHQAWVAWEWGADVLAAMIHRVSGLDGIAAISGIAIAAAIWMWFRLSWAIEANFWIAALLAGPAIAATSLHWLARPHILGWLFLMAAVWWCERGGSSGRAHLAGIAIFSALWANVHGSFFLGPLVALIYAAGTYLRTAIWRNGRTHHRYLLAAAAAAAGTLVNPYGWGLHEHVYRYLSNSALLDRVGEFQSFNFHNTGSTSVVIALIAGIGGGFAALTVRRPERFLLSLILTAAALHSARAIPLDALVLLPLAGGTFTEVLSFARGLAPAARKKLDGVLRHGDALLTFDRRFAGWALIPAAAALVFIGVHGRVEFPPDQFPVSSAGAVASLPSDARLFSTDKFGGYLIYRFAGQRAVFIDGRSDFYGADFIKRYSLIIEGQPGWREEFDRWHFNAALLPPDASLLAALETSGWREIRRDRTAVLLQIGRPGKV